MKYNKNIIAFLVFLTCVLLWFFYVNIHNLDDVVERHAFSTTHHETWPYQYRSPLIYLIYSKLDNWHAVFLLHCFMGAIILTFVWSANWMASVFLLTNAAFMNHIFLFSDILPLTFCFSILLIAQNSRNTYIFGIVSAAAWLVRGSGAAFLSILIYERQKVFYTLIFIGLTIPCQIMILKDRALPSITSSPTNGYFNFVKGNSEMAYRLYPWVDLDWGESAISDNDGIPWLVSNPQKAFSLYCRKALCLLLPYEVPLSYNGKVGCNLTISDWHMDDGFLSDFGIAEFVFKSWAYFFFLISAFTSRYWRHPAYMLVWVYLGMHMLIWMETRFRVPADPVIYCYGVTYLQCLWDKYKLKEKIFRL